MGILNVSWSPYRDGPMETPSLFHGRLQPDAWIRELLSTRLPDIEAHVLVVEKESRGERLKLSVLAPLYNEEELVGALLESVIAAPLPPGMTMEIIVADDGSTDSSVEEVEAVAARHPGAIRLLKTERNQGKGAALRRAIAEAQGDFAIIQDADLEYDPREYPRILAPLLDGRADAVYGSRFMVAGERRVLYFWHSLANHLLTGMCNIFADLNLTDMETCYKAFRTPLLKSIPIKSQRFGFEPEITIKLAKRQARIYETPISYNGRTYEEGKKIGLKDAFNAFWVILTASFSSDIYLDKDKAILDAFSDAPNFNRWIADIIKPHVGKRVLEIGAGIGNLTRVLGGEEKEIFRHGFGWRTPGAAEGPALRAPAPGNCAARCVAGGGLCPVPRAGGYGRMPERFGAHRRRSRRFDEYSRNASGWGPGHNPRPGRAGPVQLPRRRTGALPALLGRRFAPADDRGRVCGRDGAPLQPHFPARMVAEREGLETKNHQPVPTEDLRPDGMAFPAHRRASAMVPDFDHRRRA